MQSVVVVHRIYVTNGIGGDLSERIVGLHAYSLSQCILSELRLDCGWVSEEILPKCDAYEMLCKHFDAGYRVPGRFDWFKCRRKLKPEYLTISLDILIDGEVKRFVLTVFQVMKYLSSSVKAARRVFQVTAHERGQAPAPSLNK